MVLGVGWERASLKSFYFPTCVMPIMHVVVRSPLRIHEQGGLI